VSPGKLTNVAISRTYVERLDTPYNDCLNNLTSSKYNYLIKKSNTLNIMKNTLKYKIYSQNLCIKMCIQKYIYDKCNCIDLTLPPIFNIQTGMGCSTSTQIECSNNIETIFFNSDGVSKCQIECPGNKNKN
jgi:hypothetical protein